MSKGGLAGGAIGLVLFGPWGAAIGSIVGTLINPTPLFGEEDQRAQVGSVEPNLADEGTPISYAYGSQNRIGAQIVYASNPWSVQDPQGKGKRQEPATTRWFVDLIYTACFNPIKEITKIVMDADPIYLANPSIQTFPIMGANGRQVRVRMDEQHTTVRWEWSGAAWNLVAWHITIENSTTAAWEKLARFIVGVDCDLTHYLNGTTVSPVVNKANLPGGGLPNVRGKVLDSRVTGTSSTGLRNTQLVVDIQQYIIDVNNLQGLASRFVNQAGTGSPASGGAPPLISSNWYPLQPWAPQANDKILISQPETATSKFVPGVLDEDLTEIGKGATAPTSSSSLYESRVGANRAPALPAVVMFGGAKVNTSRFGNRSPTVTVFVDENLSSASERQTDYIFGRLLSDHGGIPSALIDYTDLTPEDFLGVNFAGTQPINNVISPILLGFDKHIEESDFKIKIKDRSAKQQIAVDHGHLDARPLSSPARPKLEFKETNENEIPHRIHVKFIDRDRQLDPGDVTETRDSVGGTENDVTRQFSLNYTMHRFKAREIARRLMRDVWEQSQAVSFRLPCWYAHIAESDVLVVSAANAESGEAYLGRTFWIAITQLDVGNDFFIEGEGNWLGEAPDNSPVTAEAAIADEDELNADVGRSRSITLSRPAPFQTVAMDVAPLTDEDARRAGFYIASQKPHAFDAPSGHLYRQLSGGSGWSHMKDSSSAMTVGELRTAMPSGVYGVFDYSTTVDVQVYGNEEFGRELTTATETQVLAGANLCAIGGTPTTMEICAFTTVTDLGDTDSPDGRGARLFRLSGFRRGLLGTVDRMANHGKRGGQFMLLKPGSTEFVPTELSLVGTSQTYKVIPTSGDTDDGAPVTVTVAANSSMAPPPALLDAERTAEGGVTISWLRRTRARHRVLGETDGPLVEGVESYEIVINPLTTNRTIVSTTTSCVYTSAMQTDDGTTDAELSVEAYQMDAVRGRGRVATVTLAQLGAQWLDENGTDTIVTEGLQRNIQTEN